MNLKDVPDMVLEEEYLQRHSFKKQKGSPYERLTPEGL